MTSIIASQQRIGVFGGTFDPVHLGHLLIAERALDQLALSEVRWIPAAIAPHAELKKSSHSSDRLQMVQLAISGNSRFVCDDRELVRGGKSFTVDTLLELHRDLPNARLFLLIGGDSLREFSTWRQPERICELAHVVVMARGGQPTPDLQELARYLPSQPDGPELDSHLLQLPQCEISSSEIRERVKRNKSIRYMVPAAVEAFIKQHRLYLSEI